MKLNDAARELIGNGADATLVTLNPDGSPQVSLVWVALRSTPDGDELVTGHLGEQEGGAPELLTTLSGELLDPNVFPPKDAPPGFVTHVRIDKVGGVGL